MAADWYLIQELLDNADLTSTCSQLLQQLTVLHLQPGQPIREGRGLLQVRSPGESAHLRFGRHVQFVTVQACGRITSCL